MSMMHGTNMKIIGGVLTVWGVGLVRVLQILFNT